MLPEEFPVVMAVFLALGALRLARIDVLVRRSSAIEALGAATVLCVDKTGTLTSNRMQVRALVSSTGETDLEHAGRAGAVRLREEAAHVLDVARRASRRTSVDPLDRALQETATALIDAPAIAEDPVREYGLTQDLLAVTLVWRDPDGTLRVAAKGAPEAIIGMCRLAPSEIDAIEVALARLAERGWRVLAIAEARFNGDRLPDRPDQFDFSYTGLVAFEDPLRPTVAAAVREARAAGVTVAMITGDYPATARAVALQAGIDSKAAILTGPEIARMDAAGLRQAVSRTQIFARIQPVQKLKIVEAFAANGQIVAMTGDGVNDAPALKAAHIGIAIGPRGTDVAREASDLVLLKEDFGLIVAAIRMGRRIFDNLRKVMIYITAIHVPIAGLALLPVLFGFPPLMLPVHVVLTEMIIDPVCSLAFEGEKEEANVMNRPPRAADEPIAGPAQIGLGLLQGVMLLGATLFTAWAALQLGGQTEGQSRALAFMALSAGNLLLVRVNATHQMTLPRLFDSNHRMYWAIVLLAVAALTVAVTVPVIMKVLQFEQPSLGAICLAILAGSVAVLAFDLLKRMPGVQRALGARAYMVG
jgi:Ca2+-transporting ATPase